MKILVGIMYCGEQEYPECLESIKMQTYEDFDYFTIENLPNKDAHDLLYKKFMEHENTHDLFIKIDADMVLIRDDLFERIVNKFKSTPGLKNLEIAVHDYFSNKLIWGLHTYRNDMKWIKKDDQLLVDYVYRDNFREGERLADDKEFAPAAIHCKSPSLFQSFHYGIHKALKVIQPDRKVLQPQWCTYHWDIINHIKNNFIGSSDIRIGMSLLGTEIGLTGQIQVDCLDYTNPKLFNIFKGYQDMDISQVHKIIKKLNFLNFGFLPDALRLKVLTKVNRSGTLANILHKKLIAPRNYHVEI